MVVVVEAALTVVGHKNVWPAVVVIVRANRADTPAFVADSSFGGYVGESAVMIVVKQRSARCGGAAFGRLIRTAVDEVDVQPSVVVIIQQRDTGAEGLDDVALLCRADPVLEGGQTGFRGDVLKHDGTGFDEAPRGNRTLLRVENRGVRTPGGGTAGSSRLRAFNGFTSLRCLRESSAAEQQGCEKYLQGRKRHV